MLVSVVSDSLQFIENLVICLQLQLGVDESYSLSVSGNDGRSIIGEATIEVG